MRPGGHALPDHDDLGHRPVVSLRPEVDVHVVDDAPVGEPSEIPSARLSPVAMSLAVRRSVTRKMGHENGGIHAEVVGNVQPAPSALPKCNDDLRRNPGLRGKEVDHGEFVRMDPRGMPITDRLDGDPVDLADGQVEVTKSVAVQNHPGRDLGLGLRRRSGHHDADRHQESHHERSHRPLPSLPRPEAGRRTRAGYTLSRVSPLTLQGGCHPLRPFQRIVILL